MSKDEKLDFLEDERKKLWAKVLELEDDLRKKTPDYESEAKDAAAAAIVHKRTAEEAATSVNTLLQEISATAVTINATYGEVNKQASEIKANAELAKTQGSQITLTYQGIETQASGTVAKIQEIEKILEGKPLLDEKITRLETVFTQGDDYDTKLGTLFKSITDRKKEIDDLYYRIIGFTDEKDGSKVEGLKGELESAFTQAKSNIDRISEEISLLNKETRDDYHTFITEKEELFSRSSKSWAESYEGIENKINALLPKALTAGLSFAYSEKKEVEENESKWHQRYFIAAIIGLILVSLIPLWVSFKSVEDGDLSLEGAILRIPRLVLAILPLYIPISWVAYSSSKKLSLSKRLIEEYSHKEVLSKTFEGLSRQIAAIDDEDISEELRIKLLYNILEVNSENPGKLISDYNKSDHPLMDALDKSVKLTNAVSKLARIPGFGKLAESLAKKADEILDSQAKKAEAGLASQSKQTGTETKKA